MNEKGKLLTKLLFTNPAKNPANLWPNARPDRRGKKKKKFEFGYWPQSGQFPAGLTGDFDPFEFGHCSYSAGNSARFRPDSEVAGTVHP